MSKTSKAPRNAGHDVLLRLGKSIRDHRNARGLTQAALADALDISVAYLSLIERGGRNAPYATVVEIAGALGLHVGDLLPSDRAVRSRG